MDFDDSNQQQGGGSDIGIKSDGMGGNQDSSGNGTPDNREKDRDRRGRGARGTRFSDADGGNRDRSRERRNCRVYISNIPYDYRWQDLKDLFRRIVGSVEYVELFHDESGKARGCGIVEFKDPDNVEKALEKMNRYEINGRELVVKEDHGENRDQYGRIVRDGMGGPVAGGSGGGMPGGGARGGGAIASDRDRGFSRRSDDDRLSGQRNNFSSMMSNDYNNSPYNFYGLSASFLESLGINGPLHNKVFVANLDYKVDSKKLKQVFKLAGKVQSVDLSVDKEGNSRGFAVVEYDHPVEAVQAISMLDRQMLFDRRMTVRLDRIPDKGEGLKLPEGLGGVGIGLGPNGEPLRDVARNLPNMMNQSQQQHHSQGQSQSQQISSNSSSNMNMGGMFNSPAQPSPVAPVVSVNKSSSGNSLMGSGGGLNLGHLSSTNLAALTNVVGGLGAALSNPLLTSSLSNLGLNLGQAPITPNNDDSMPPTTALTNNYSTGNNYSSGYSAGYNAGGGGVGGSSSGGGGGGGGSFDNSSLRNSYNTGVQDNNDYNTSSNIAEIFGNNNNSMSVGGGGNAGRKSDTIIIKNIPLSCTWQTLRDKFRDVGEVKFAEIRGNDVGVVRFFKERDAELAIALMDGSRMDGRTIKVTFF